MVDLVQHPASIRWCVRLAVAFAFLWAAPQGWAADLVVRTYNAHGDADSPGNEERLAAERFKSESPATFGVIGVQEGKGTVFAELVTALKASYPSSSPTVVRHGEVGIVWDANRWRNVGWPAGTSMLRHAEWKLGYRWRKAYQRQSNWLVGVRLRKVGTNRVGRFFNTHLPPGPSCDRIPPGDPNDEAFKCKWPFHSDSYARTKMTDKLAGIVAAQGRQAGELPPVLMGDLNFCAPVDASVCFGAGNVEPRNYERLSRVLYLAKQPRDGDPVMQIWLGEWEFNRPFETNFAIERYFVTSMQGVSDHPSPALALSFAPAGAPRQANGSVMQSGEMLRPGTGITSANGRYTLSYQTDGNLVLYDRRTALWSSKTHGQPAGMVLMQRDGNLVVLRPDGRRVWSSATAGQRHSHLVLQDDGNAVLRRPDGGAAWSTDTWIPTGDAPRGDTMKEGDVLEPGRGITSTNGRYTFTYQGDGNVVLYYGARHALWASGTNGKRLGVLVLQHGNLVIKARGGAVVWSSGAKQEPGSRLEMQTDGNAVIYRSDGKAIWATNTVHVPRVRFSQHLDFGGRSIFPRDDERDFRTLGFNDQLSSLHVPAYTCVTLYEHVNHQGASKEFCAHNVAGQGAPRDVAWIGDDWNDRASSSITLGVVKQP